MKLLPKILLSTITVAFLITYVSIGKTILHFSYLFMEASMILVIIYGTIRMILPDDFRKNYGRKVFSGQLTLLLVTHILRIFWLIERDAAAFQFTYFLKGNLFMNTLLIAGNSFLIACGVSLVILFLRLPKKKMQQVAVMLLIIFTGMSGSFYLYTNRDLSEKGIYFDYSIDNIEEIQQLAIDKEKTVYVDFWHSGCSPCLDEFSQHENFRKLVDEQRVHLLFIGADRSVPGEKQKQRSIIERYNLKGTHTFISKEEFSNILDDAGFDYQIHGYKAFPHHMIISSNGEILEVKAQGPSSVLASRLNSSN